MGHDIVLVSGHLLCKPPQDGHPVAWRQDGAFARIDPMTLVRGQQLSDSLTEFAVDARPRPR